MSGKRNVLSGLRAVVALMAFLASGLATAQTTTGVANDGTATDGQSLWTSKGCSGCHTVSGARANAANAGGHITYANGQGMGGAAVTTTERENIAAYIASLLTTTLPTQSVTFGGSKTFTVPGITLNTAYGDYIGVRTATNPTSRGTVSYSGTSVTYTASANQCGTDTFSYEAYRSGAAVQGSGTSSERSVTMDIADPAAPNIASSSGVLNGTYNLAMTTATDYNPTSTGGPVYEYDFSLGTLPMGLSLVTTTGRIAGTPTQTGTFNVTLRARNCLNGVLTGQSSTRAIVITIARAAQAALTARINGLSAPTAVTFGAAAQPLSTIGGSGTGAVTYASTTTGVCTVTGVSPNFSVNYVGGGTCNITATKAQDANYLVTSDVVSVTVNPTTQAALTARVNGLSTDQIFTYQFPNQSVPLSIIGGSGSGAVSYGSSNTADCSVSGTTLTLTGAGTCTITATKAASASYLVATDTIGVTVNATVPAAPTIGAGVGGNAFAVVNFTPPSNNGGNPILDYRATCNPGGITATNTVSPVTVTGLTNGTSYTCSVTARTVTGTGAASGTVSVLPTSAPAFTTPSSGTMTIGMNSTINITASGAPAPLITRTAGTLPAGVTFTQGNGAATFSGTPAAGSAGSYVQTLNAMNSGGSVNQTFTLNIVKQNQTITFAPLANRGFRSVPFQLSATASSGLPVSFFAGGLSSGICTVSPSGLVTMLALGTCTPVAAQGGDGTYSAATTVPRAFTILQGSQVLTEFGNLVAPQTYSPGGTFDIVPESFSVDQVDMATPTGLDAIYTSLTTDVCTVVKATVTIHAAGDCTIEASQPGSALWADALAVQANFLIAMAPQTITWGAQASQSFGSGGTFAISPLASGGGSGNVIVYGSTTPTVCTVAGTTVTKLTTGTCTLSANQAGDSNYLPASQVLQNVTINASVPDAPIVTAVTPSDSQILVEFDPPTNNGGSPITSYRATCGPSGGFTDGTASPILVVGLTNGVNYSCSVRATNAAGAGAASNAISATPFLETGVNLWSTVCKACHGDTPSAVRFNAAGTTGTVINYVRSVQPVMLETPAVQALTIGELAEVAKYIATFVPAISVNTAFNTSVPVDVSSHLTLGTVTFDGAQVVDLPTNGLLTTFNGTQITYTPTAGFVGVDTFTYRGFRTTPTVQGDKRTVTITVAAPPAPVITSPAIANGTFGQVLNYQITATNTPTSFGASGLGGGFSVNPTTGVISGTPGAAGSFTVTVSATNAGGTGMQSVDVTISKANQTITFPPQSSANYSLLGSVIVFPAATASSGLTIAYSSLTADVCTVSGNLVLFQSAGNCQIAANQSGNANYNAALQVTQTIVINPVVPDAPTIGAATGGDTIATINFTPPANNGGSPITSYTASCTPSGSSTGPSSPITVTGLTNGTPYSCQVRATNAAGNGAFSGSVAVTPTATPVAPQIVSANATTFTVLSAGSFTVGATGTPAPTLALTGTLPMGVTFTPGTGALAGTPASGSVGAYPVTITATSTTMPAAMQSFTLTVQKANQIILFTGPASRPFSATPIALNATATSGLAASFSSNTPSVCTVAGNSLTLVTVGVCSITASQPGDADYNAATSVTQGFTVSQATQAITFPAQSPASRGFVSGSTYSVSPTASASSSLTVLYSSNSPSICSVVGTTVTMNAVGTCVIAANQSGSANFFAATEVTQAVAQTATVPGAPTIGTATGGNAQATINFTAPTNNGGSAITSYTATCNPGAITGSGAASPITVSGLTNSTAYTCSVTAANGVGTGAPSGTVNVTPLSGQGATIWANVCKNCHGTTPVGNQLNGAGTTATVIDFVRQKQTLMAGPVGVLFGVQALSLADLADVATYIAANIPENAPTTPVNTAVLIDVSNHIVFTNHVTPPDDNWSAFTSVEVVTGPANGSLGAFSGTAITYTPNNGFVGTDTFTYRGKRAEHNGDPQTITITVTPAVPVINSVLTANGVRGSAFAYQITATNLPTSFTATGLPAGLNVDTNTGAITGTPTQAGSFNVPLSASNAGGTANAVLVLQIDLTPQTITFPAQSPTSRPFSAGGTFAINPLATGGASTSPVVYGTTTPSVCTVATTTVTMVGAGTCTIIANQAGDANFAPAITVAASVIIDPVAPGAPTIGAASAGNGQASVNFTTPSNNGGSPIVSYTVTCGSVFSSGSASPVTVTGLANGVAVNCSVTAMNAAGLTGAASSSVSVTPVSIAFANEIYSRKTHAGTTYDLPIDTVPIVTGAVTVEPRSESSHRVVFRFTAAPTSVANVTVTDALGAPIGTPSVALSDNDVIVTLTDIPDASRVRVAVTGVNGALDVEAALGFLVGDVSGTGVVTGADIVAIKSRIGAAMGVNGNFRFDLNLSGGINSTDVSAAKARAGTTLP